MTNQLIKRDIFTKISNYLDRKEILLITGPRRSGKTTFLKYLQETLEPSNTVLYYNLDFTSDKDTIDTHDKVVFLLEQLLQKEPKKKIYLMIDEIQTKENAGKYLKGIYDYIDYKNLSVQLIVTGSGSVELKEKISESLAGRKITFMLNTLSFKEFLRYKESLKLPEDLLKFQKLFPEKMKMYLNEYCNYGGYPQVVLENDMTVKVRLLDEIYSSYIQKDLIQLMHIEKSESLAKLVQILASQPGSMINYGELSNTLRISQDTVKKYIYYLEQTYSIAIVRPFFSNTRSEISKAPVVYFNDLGLRSYVLRQFNFDAWSGQNGFVFENFIYRLISDNLSFDEKINYWRTKSGAEMDFIVSKGNKMIPIEVKMRELSADFSLTRSFSSFLDSYKPSKAYFYHLGDFNKRRKGNVQIEAIPYYYGIMIESK